MGSQRIELDTDHRVSRVWPLLELLYDTTLGQHFLGDGFTPGGIQPDAAQPDPYVFSVDDIPDGGILAAKLGASSVTTAALASGSVTDGVLAPNVLQKHVTRAALFEPGIAGSMQRCSFSFDPTDDTLTYRFKRRGLAKPAAGETRVWGGSSASNRQNLVYVNTAGVYTVEMRAGVSTVLLSYAWTDDLEEHAWEARFTNAGCILLLDGTPVHSAAVAATFQTIAITWVIAQRVVTATDFTSDHAIYRDVEVIDPATATNKVFLRLDEPSGGPYRNAYLALGDPLYDATNTSAVTVATTGTDTSRPKSVDVLGLSGGAATVIAGGGTRHTRVAAFGGLGDAATAGEFGTVTWAPTGTPAFNVEFDCRRSLTQAGDVIVWGRQSADYANINITAAGVVQARVNSTNICTSTVVVLPPDGRTRRTRVEFRDSGADVTAAIYVDRRLVASGTLAATQFSPSPGSHNVGGPAAGNRRWSGSIFNVLIEDLNSAANSGFYLMDEPVTATTYANTYPGTSLAALTKNGYVGVAAVESEDGRGMPWQFGSGAALVYSARRSTDITTTGSATYVIVWNQEELDPTGSLLSGVLTSPVAGRVHIAWNLVLEATTLPTPDAITLVARVGGLTLRAMPRAFTTAGETVHIYFEAPAEIAAAGVAQVELGGLDPAATYTVKTYSSVAFTLYPTPTTG